MNENPFPHVPQISIPAILVPEISWICFSRVLLCVKVYHLTWSCRSVKLIGTYWWILISFPLFFFFFKALLVYSRFTVVRKRKPVHFSFFLSHHKEEKKTHLVIVLCKWTGQRGFLTSGWLSDTSSAWMHPITQIIIFQEFI